MEKTMFVDMLIALILMALLFFTFGWRHDYSVSIISSANQLDAIDLLDNRFARGEIDVDEYMELQDNLL
jgi:uncharacterized membrane protein